MKIKLYCCFAAMILLGTALTAQRHFDIANVSYKYAPGAPAVNGGPDLTENSLTADVLLPLQLKTGNAILAGVNFEHVMLSLNSELHDAEHYFPTRFMLGYQHQFKNGGTFTGLFLPSVKSNWKNIDSRHIQYGAYARYDLMLNKNVKLKVGGYVNTEISSLFFVPLISMDYYGFDRWHFYGVLPVNYNIMYSVSDRFRAGIRYQGLLNSIFVEHTSAVPGYWERAPQEGYLSFEYYIHSSVVLRAMAGHTVLRSVSFYHHDQSADFRLSAIPFGDNRTPLYKAGDAPVFQFSVIFRYDLSEDRS